MIKSLFEVVILAGGLATRLRPLTEKIPKALVEINGTPFIDHQLRLLKAQGVSRVVICAGYLGEMIEEYVGKGHRYQLDVEYVFDGPQLLGTGGALKRALPKLGKHFFVLYGDSYLVCDYQAVQNYFLIRHQQALMTVFKNQGLWDKSNIEFVDNEILVYDKINVTSNMHHIDYGLGILSQQAFALVPENQVFDLATLYQQLLAEKQLAAYEVQQRFYEVGSVKGIQELSEYLEI